MTMYFFDSGTRQTKKGGAQKDIAVMDAFWIYLISQTFERGRRQQGAPPPQRRIFFPEDKRYRLLY